MSEPSKIIRDGQTYHVNAVTLNRLIAENAILRQNAKDDGIAINELASTLRELLHRMGSPAGRPTPGSLSAAYEFARAALVKHAAP